MTLLQSKLLNKHINLIHGFTTRELGGDIRRIADTLKVSADTLVTIKQTHSNRVFQYPFDTTDERSKHCQEGDALITQQRGILLGIRVADCVPILLYDPRHNAVVAIHAGWRGLISGIIENTLTAMNDLSPINGKNLVASLGPALCRNCFEIGPEVAQKFGNKFGARLKIVKGEGDRSFVDLRHACRLVLSHEGLPSSNIEELPYCTRCQPDLFYSYRRGDKGGRMLAFIGLS